MEDLEIYKTCSEADVESTVVKGPDVDKFRRNQFRYSEIVKRDSLAKRLRYKNTCTDK